MQVIYLLIPLSLVFLVGAVWAVRFAIKTNQYEDMDSEASRIILDDREAMREAEKQRNHLVK